MPPIPIVHIVDDDDSFRAAILFLLKAAKYEARGYSSAVEFLLADPGDAPGCLILDIHMPGTNGLDFQEALAKRGHALPIIFVTGGGDIPMSVRAMKAGAVDFLTKPVERKALLGAIRAALARDAEDRSARANVQSLRACYETLSPREREVFALVIAGKLNKHIAGELGMTESTVKAHRAQIMVKMHVDSFAELLRAAAQLERLSEKGSGTAG